MRKKPLQLGGLEWGGLAFHCWTHRLGVRLVWASQDQELGETSCPLSWEASPWVVSGRLRSCSSSTPEEVVQ